MISSYICCFCFCYLISLLISISFSSCPVFCVCTSICCVSFELYACVQTVGDLQCDSYSETAANPVLLYVLRAPAAPNASDADISDLNLRSQSNKDKSVTASKHERDQHKSSVDRYVTSLPYFLSPPSLSSLTHPSFSFPLPPSYLVSLTHAHYSTPILSSISFHLDN